MSDAAGGAGPESATMPEDAGADLEVDEELDDVELDDIDDPDDVIEDFEADVGDDDLSEAVDDGNRRLGGLSAGVLEYVARSIVDEPDAVRVDVDDSHRRGVELRLTVAPDDIGKVIGKRGRTITAIRTVVRAAGTREGTEVGVEVVD